MKEKLELFQWFFQKTKAYLLNILFITLLASVSSVFSVGMALISKNLVDYAVAGQFTRAFHQGIFFTIFIIMLLIINVIISIVSVRVTEEMSNKMRLDIYKQLSYSEWIAFSSYHSDDILTRMTSDVNVVVTGTTEVVPNMIALFIQLILAFWALFSIDHILGILAFALGPLTVLFYSFFRKKLRSMHIRIQELEGYYRAASHEAIQNMVIVKAFDMESQSIKKIGSIQNERLNIVLKRNKLGIIAHSSFSVGYWAGYFLAFIWGTFRLSHGLATFGSLTAFLQLVGQVQSPVIGLASSIPHLISTEASATRLIELERIRPENRDGEKIQWEKAGIIFENVSFSYTGEADGILKNINLVINPEEIVGITGLSGVGKTTIIRLLLALVKPNEGKIYVANKSKKTEVTALCRDIISYVPQGNTLFSGTIAENLSIANPKVTIEEMKEALKQADAWEFIQKMPDGLQAMIGENAIRLSEGQAQRISIARALLKRCSILLLDEATSALDSATELNILETIRKMHPARTCIIITHRHSALSVCNRIFRMRDGNIEENTLYQ